MPIQKSLQRLEFKHHHHYYYLWYIDAEEIQSFGFAIDFWNTFALYIHDLKLSNKKQYIGIKNQV